MRNIPYWVETDNSAQRTKEGSPKSEVPVDLSGLLRQFTAGGGETRVAIRQPSGSGHESPSERPPRTQGRPARFSETARQQESEAVTRTRRNDRSRVMIWAGRRWPGDSAANTTGMVRGCGGSGGGPGCQRRACSRRCATWASQRCINVAVTLRGCLFWSSTGFQPVREEHRGVRGFASHSHSVMLKNQRRLSCDCDV